MIWFRIFLLTLVQVSIVLTNSLHTGFCNCAFGVLDCSKKSVIPFLHILSRNPPCKRPIRNNLTFNRLKFNSLGGVLSFPGRRFEWRGGVVTYGYPITSIPALKGWVTKWTIRYDKELNATRIDLINSSDLLGVVLIGNKFDVLNVSSANELRVLYAERDFLHTVVLPNGKCLLTDLYLYDNKFTSLPIGLSKCSNLRILGVSNNDLLVLDASPLLTLNSLFARNIQMLAITKPLDSLHVLDIGENKLTKLPVDILRIPNLRELIVSNNNMTTMDLSLFNGLHHVDASNCSIVEWIPPTVNCSLQSVILQNNKLAYIPRAINMCNYLITLDLRNNSLYDFSKKFLELLKLRPLTSKEQHRCSPTIDVDLRGNMIPKNIVWNLFQNYGNTRYPIENNYTFNRNACECSVLSVKYRERYINYDRYAPVKICVSSMCDKYGRSLWKYL